MSLNVRVCVQLSQLDSIMMQLTGAAAYFEDGGRRYAMREQVIELRSDLQYPCRRPLFDDLLCNDLDQRLPVRWR